MTHYFPQTGYEIIMLLAGVFFNIHLDNLCSIQKDRRFLDIDPLADFLVFGLDVASVLRFFLIQNEEADSRCQGMFQDVDDLGFCRCSFHAVGHLLDDDLDSITLDGMVDIVSADKEIILFFIHGYKTKAILMGPENPRHSRGFFFFFRGQANPAVPCKDQLSLAFHLGNQLNQLCKVFGLENP